MFALHLPEAKDSAQAVLSSVIKLYPWQRREFWNIQEQYKISM